MQKEQNLLKDIYQKFVKEQQEKKREVIKIKQPIE